MTAVLNITLLAATAVAFFFGARLFLGQDRLIFRPVSPLARTPADIAIPFTPRQLPLAGGQFVDAWWVPASDARHTVLYFHGSESALSRELRAVWFFQRLGVNALLVEYPGYGRANGRPTEAGCYAAADAAFDFLTTAQGIDPTEIILSGHSLGTAVATYLAARHFAARPPVAGLVLHSPFISVPELAARRYPFLPVRPFLRTRMDSAARLPLYPGPVLLLHSADDEHIPIAHAEHLCQVANPPRKLVRLRGSHFGRPWPDDPAVRAAWRELLAGDFTTWEREPTRANRPE